MICFHGAMVARVVRTDAYHRYNNPPVAVLKSTTGATRDELTRRSAMIEIARHTGSESSARRYTPLAPPLARGRHLLFEIMDEVGDPGSGEHDGPPASPLALPPADPPPLPTPLPPPSTPPSPSPAPPPPAPPPFPPAVPVHSAEELLAALRAPSDAVAVVIATPTIVLTEAQPPTAQSLTVFGPSALRIGKRVLLEAEPGRQVRGRAPDLRGPLPPWPPLVHGRPPSHSPPRR